MTFTHPTSVDSNNSLNPATGIEQVVYQSARTRVVRTLDADGEIIVKEPRGARSAERVRHETSILTRLAGIDGVPVLAESGRAGTIALRDGGTALAAVRLSMPDFVDFALELARIVAAVHRKGVVHKDINPANIVVAGTPPRPTLIDFDLASTFAEERPGFTHQSQVTGTLAYLAPEQTGRTGRAVDQRADMYSLGATLYTVVTGEPPFGDGEPLELIHAHLARVPVPPIERNPAVPPALSEIILRLLEKEPDRRPMPGELAKALTRFLNSVSLARR